MGAFGTAPERGVLVPQNDYPCPPNPDRPITKPRFPPPGFLRLDPHLTLQVADSRLSRQSQIRESIAEGSVRLWGYGSHSPSNDIATRAVRRIIE